MIRNLGAILLIGATLGFVLYHLYKFSVSINNPKSKLIGQLKNMRETILEKFQDFVPMELDEFKRLSAEVIKVGMLKIGSQYGMIKSIFNEDLVYFQLEKTAVENTTLLYVKSANLDVGFMRISDQTDIYQNGVKIGNIDQDYNLKDYLGNVIGGIIFDDNERFKLVFQNEKVCQILKPAHISVPGNTRLLNDINESILPSNDLVQSLLFFYMINELS
ncbi:MAG TPA: hypothetical protein PLY70_03825 [Saprospiraceae bacterium]|nr:hypothetical protein [Saprospiraceae bacterium]HPN69814.1 hypothetical protein [Saprospiraceae bacterium]